MLVNMQRRSFFNFLYEKNGFEFIIYPSWGYAPMLLGFIYEQRE